MSYLAGLTRVGSRGPFSPCNQAPSGLLIKKKKIEKSFKARKVKERTHIYLKYFIFF